MLRVGLVGTGGISGAHIPAWESIPEAKLVALCDVRTERFTPYPQQNHYTDLDEMLKNENLDILDVCLPTYLHTQAVLKGLEHGVHVVCEKPISLNLEDVDQIYSTAYRNNVNFMVAQVVRFMPEYELLKEIYDSGRYGRLLTGYMKRISSRPRWSYDNWMADETRSGFVPFDMHIHDLDYMVATFGKPKNVDCHRCKQPSQDYISVVYDYSDFFITAESAWYAAPLPFSATFRFQFEKALIVYDGHKCIIYQGDNQILDMSAESNQDTGSISAPKTNAYANELQYFTNCVLSGQFPDKIKAEELKSVIEIVSSF